MKSEVTKLVAWMNDHGKDHIVIQQEPDEKLSIELTGGLLLVGYYYEQDGDLVPDPVLIVNLANYKHQIETALGITSQDATYARHFLIEVNRRLKGVRDAEVKDRRLDGARADAVRQEGMNFFSN